MSDPCTPIRPLLPGLADRDLDPASEARVLRHLEACAACRREAAALARVGALLAEHPAPEAVLPAGSVVAARLLARSGQRRALRWASACALAAVLGIAILRPAPQPVAAPTTAVAAELPILVVEDDERFGRMVLIAPAAGGLP